MASMESTHSKRETPQQFFTHWWEVKNELPMITIVSMAAIVFLPEEVILAHSFKSSTIEYKTTDVERNIAPNTTPFFIQSQL